MGVPRQGFPAHQCDTDMASVIKRISEYNSGIPAGLREIKRTALKETPFRFYRGTCHLFAADFAKLYKAKPKVKSWICGDLHFENFGAYKGETRLVYFDIDDFDECVLAGPEAELARFLTSVLVSASQMKVTQIGQHKVLHDIVNAYVATIQRGKALMMEAEVAHGEFKRYFEHLSTLERDAFIDKRTHKKKGALLLKTDDERYLQLDDRLKSGIYKGLGKVLNGGRFEHLVYEDAAFRVSGTGSLGLQRYCVLCYSSKKGKHYLLDVKEARQSCYTGLTGVRQPKFKNEAERVVTIGGQMQYAAPAFATCAKIDNKWFIVKELQSSEDRLDLEYFDGDFVRCSEVATEMAVLVAYAHVRSSGHFGASTADELKRFAEKKQWQKDIIELSGDLARRTNKYYKEFLLKG